MRQPYGRPAEATEPPSIYTRGNKYGYKININHPQIKPLYDRYRAWKGIKMIPSDAERLEFEAYIVKLLEEREGKHHEQELHHPDDAGRDKDI